MQTLMVVRFGTIDRVHHQITSRVGFIWLWHDRIPIMTRMGATPMGLDHR